MASGFMPTDSAPSESIADFSAGVTPPPKNATDTPCKP